MSLLAWLLAALATAQAAGPAPQLDFETYKTDVQPVLLHKRLGLARCYVCHSQGTAFRLEPLPVGASTWDEAASKKNFEAVRRYVVPGNPGASRLLTLPLSAEAGGAPFHPGGKHWASENDPEWQRVATWIRGAKAGR